MNLPVVYGKKRRFNKKKNKRRINKRRNNRSSLTIRGVSTLPDSVFVKLKYTQLSLRVATAQPNTTCVYRGNSPYDPDWATGGHSALGYDQWSTLYHNYRVHKSDIYVKIAYSSQPLKIAVVPTSQFDRPLNIGTAYEFPYAKCKTIPTTVAPDPFVKASMYSKKIWGLKSIQYEDNCQSQYDTVPQDQWFWKIFFSSYDHVTNMDCYVDIMILYYVEFFNRVELQQSGTILLNRFGETGPQDSTYTTSYIGATGSVVGATGSGLG